MAIKLIIVDDAPFIREIIRNAIESENFRVVGEAVNGEEAVSLVLRLRPDVIIMDLVMPEMNGLEAVEKIIDEWPEAKIIACSTLDQEDMVNKALDAGCCNYLTKPFEKPELIKAIEEAIRS